MTAAPGALRPADHSFAADGSVALDSLERLAHESIDAGAAGLVALGHHRRLPLHALRQGAVVDVCFGPWCIVRCVERAPSLFVGGDHQQHREVNGGDGAGVAGGPPGALTAVLTVVPYDARPARKWQLLRVLLRPWR